MQRLMGSLQRKLAIEIIRDEISDLPGLRSRYQPDRAAQHQVPAVQRAWSICAPLMPELPAWGGEGQLQLAASRSRKSSSAWTPSLSCAGGGTRRPDGEIARRTQQLADISPAVSARPKSPERSILLQTLPNNRTVKLPSRAASEATNRPSVYSLPIDPPQCSASSPPELHRVPAIGGATQTDHSPHRHLPGGAATHLCQQTDSPLLPETR